MARSRLLMCALALAPLLLGAASCPEQQPPPWNVELWAGAPAQGAIVRAQAGQVLACTDPTFADYFAARWEALQVLHEIMMQCRDWGDGALDAQQAIHLLEVYAYGQSDSAAVVDQVR